MSRPPVDVVVGVLTYRRAQGLRELLTALDPQVGDRGDGTVARILVVDNDPQGSASWCSTWADVTYVHEPRPGIATARNRALDEASGAAAVVFVDDDEIPGDTWLATLLSHWRSSGVTAVAGPVIPLFRHEIDPWIRAGGFFDRPRRASGTSLAGAATNNLLLDMTLLRASGVRFDQQFGLTGGSDTMLTHALVRAGHRLEWCDEATVEEVVPPSRTTRQWVRRRAFRTGTVWSRVDLRLRTGPFDRLVGRTELTARGLVRMVQGAGRVMRGLAGRDLGLRARGVRDIAAGGGALLGAWGYVYTEYRRGPCSAG